jgi:HPt (histidine-containing phosphotransfer) domain-containing protein
MDGYVSKPIVAEKLRAVLQGLRPDMAGVSSVPTGAAPVFDYGAALGKADAWVIDTIGAVFLDDCDRQMQEITDAVREQDAVLLLRGAHTLRGLVGNFNASRIVELAHRIESLAEQGDMQRAAEPAELLRHELELLKSALTAYLGAKRS